MLSAIGTALSSLCSGPVAQAFGWRAAMVLAAIPALFLIPALLTLQVPQTSLAVSLSGEQSPWSILRIPTLWWIIASGAIFNFTMYAFAVFLASFLMRVHGFSLASTGIASACIFGIGGVLGGIASGRVGDHVAVKRGTAPAALIAALLASSASYNHSALVAVITLLAPAYGFFKHVLRPCLSFDPDIVAPSLRGDNGVCFVVMYLGGASFGSLITGNLSDRLARRAAGSSELPRPPKQSDCSKLCYYPQAIALALVLYAGSRTMKICSAQYSPKRQRGQFHN
jgi:predicted MFS family arabinose efflux permease